MQARAESRTGFDVLVDYVMWLAESQPKLVQEAARKRNIGPLVAEALLAMSADVHAPEERAVRDYRVLKLKKEETQARLDEANEKVTIAA